MRSPNFALSLRCLVLACLLSSLAALGQTPRWIGTWATAPVPSGPKEGEFADRNPEGTTLRELVHISVGGPQARILLSNEFGTTALEIGSASLALPGTGGAIVPGSAHAVTFGGRGTISIPAGALVVSDPVELAVKPLSDLAVSLYLPQQSIARVTLHTFADQTNYAATGNQAASTELTAPQRTFAWAFLKGVDVRSDSPAAGSIVAFGDSITDGAHSSRDANARWPDVLAARLVADRRTAHLGVLNEGIGGNRVLHDGTGPSALARFDRDVIAQAGVKYVILMESINDIGHAADPDPAHRYDIVTAEDLIVGLQQLALRAHTHGIRVIGATLTPYVGAKYQSPAGEQMRQAVNQWIRTTHDLDGVIDFDQVTRDPANPGVFLPADDSGDHLHPGDAGYKAMGDAIRLSLFSR